jgi:hypothetical protein
VTAIPVPVAGVVDLIVSTLGGVAWDRYRSALARIVRLVLLCQIQNKHNALILLQ